MIGASELGLDKMLPLQNDIGVQFMLLRDSLLGIPGTSGDILESALVIHGGYIMYWVRVQSLVLYRLRALNAWNNAQCLLLRLLLI